MICPMDNISFTKTSPKVMSVLLGKEVLMPLSVRTLVCYVMTPCNVVDGLQHFGGRYCFSCTQKMVRGIVFV